LDDLSLRHKAPKDLRQIALKATDINPEIREPGFLNAAQQLFEASGRLELPTVDAVRR
jgi:hypothetical protein